MRNPPWTHAPRNCKAEIHWLAIRKDFQGRNRGSHVLIDILGKAAKCQHNDTNGVFNRKPVKYSKGLRLQNPKWLPLLLRAYNYSHIHVPRLCLKSAKCHVLAVWQSTIAGFGLLPISIHSMKGTSQVLGGFQDITPVILACHEMPRFDQLCYTSLQPRSVQKCFIQGVHQPGSGQSIWF